MQTEKTKLRVLNGMESIGANIIQIQYGKYQIITDFGIMNGAPDDLINDPACTQTLLDQNYLPKVSGIYPSSSLSSESDLEAYETSDLETIICISHLHLDHIGALMQVAKEVPVYASQESVDFYHMLVASGYLPEYQVNWQGQAYNEQLHHGPFTITFRESDHDTKGISAIFIESPDLKLIHSGDFRYGGFHPDKVVQWGRKARKWQPDILFIEGTSYSFKDQGRPATEEDLLSELEPLPVSTEEKLLTTINFLLEGHSDRLFAFNGYYQNVERLLRLADLARKHDRVLALDDNYYKLVESYQNRFGHISNNYEPVDSSAIKAHPERYILNVDYEAYTDMFEYPAGLYLHSNGMPLGPFMDSFEPFVNDLKEHGWHLYNASCSGHAFAEDLLGQAYLAQSKLTVPWHTLQAKAYSYALEERGVKTWLPVHQQTYTFTND